MLDTPLDLPDWLDPSSSFVNTIDHSDEAIETIETIETTPDAPAIRAPRRAVKELSLAEYDLVFPRVLEMLYEGYTLTNALKEFPYAINRGGFMRWVKSDPQRRLLLDEAYMIRTEAWADEAIKHARGDETADDVSRSKLVVDTYMRLMGAHNRKVYGDTKQIEVGGQISVLNALQAANQRLQNVIDLPLVEDDDPPRLTTVNHYNESSEDHD